MSIYSVGGLNQKSQRVSLARWIFMIAPHYFKKHFGFRISFESGKKPSIP